jgi:uncharacterized protein (DUF362 family)
MTAPYYSYENVSKVYVRKTDGKDIIPVISNLMEEMEWEKVVPLGGFVIIKPNFCEFRLDKINDANTSYQVLEALCIFLSSRSRRLAIVESDGLRYQIEEVYSMMNLEKLAKRYGVELVNLSKDRQVKCPEPLLEGFDLPAIIGECDCFISLPKLKTHALTYFTGALKNQWGCIPRPDRILLHKHLHDLIPRLNQLLKPRLAIMDALTAMEGRGPTNGTRRELSLLIASRDLVALDATAMRLVGLDPKNARHVVKAAVDKVGRMEEGEIHVDIDSVTAFDRFIPAKKEWTLELMNYLTRYPAFVTYILLNDNFFKTAKTVVTMLRKCQLS